MPESHTVDPALISSEERNRAPSSFTLYCSAVSSATVNSICCHTAEMPQWPLAFIHTEEINVVDGHTDTTADTDIRDYKLNLPSL